jgi:hypothetical protein
MSCLFGDAHTLEITFGNGLAAREEQGLVHG